MVHVTCEMTSKRFATVENCQCAVAILKITIAVK